MEPENILYAINAAFDIALKAEKLRDMGVLKNGLEVSVQAAKVGESLWQDYWNDVSDDGSPKKDSQIDRGDAVVIK